MKPETKTKLRELAEADCRTMSNWLEQTIDREHAKLKRRKPKE